MPIYRTNGQTINRLQALSLFITTCRLSEANIMTAVRAWSNGVDTAATAAGTQLRETVRRTSAVQIIPDTEERAAFANPDFASTWALFTDERSVAISALKAKGLEALLFAVATAARSREPPYPRRPAGTRHEAQLQAMPASIVARVTGGPASRGADHDALDNRCRASVAAKAVVGNESAIRQRHGVRGEGVHGRNLPTACPFNRTLPAARQINAGDAIGCRARVAQGRAP
jgi:hypothetical protein